MPLIDSQCRAAKPAARRYKMTDARGLSLLVLPSGARIWNHRYYFDGKARDDSLGQYPEVTLASARLKRDAARLLVSEGRDPRAKRVRNQGAEVSVPVDVARRFETVAREWFETAIVPTRKADYARRVWRRVEADLLPPLGAKDVGAITPADVLVALQAIENRKALYSARTIGRYASAIFRFARPSRGLTGNPAEGLADSLRPLPAPIGQPRLGPDQVALFYYALDRPHQDEELTRLALELVMHTVLRSSELRGGRWTEIRGAEWHVPAERMKMKRPHVVPLSRQAVGLLARLRELTPDRPLIFPGRRPGHPISENTILFAIYGLGFKGRASAHGWRATFSTWAHDSGRWPSEHIEACLAHVDKNAVRRAYNNADHLAHRREIMQAWSDWLDVQREVADLL